MHNQAQTRSFVKEKSCSPVRENSRSLQILTEEKQVMSGELSQRFNVSEDSIRRDLRELAAEGKLQRVHGGALPVSAAIAPIETRKKRADRLQAGGRPRRRCADPAWTGGDCRWRHHHCSNDRLFTCGTELYGGHPQPRHRRGAGGPPANRGSCSGAKCLNIRSSL